MIKDIKDILCTEEVYNIYSACMFKPTFEKFKIKAVKMQNDSAVRAYGYFCNEKITGVIVVKELVQSVEIIGISVVAIKRGLGIGTTMLDYIEKRYKKKIIAETDSDAVVFYKKYGFDIEKISVSKNGSYYDRYFCELNRFYK